jgi:hypothetical protein
LNLRSFMVLLIVALTFLTTLTPHANGTTNQAQQVVEVQPRELNFTFRQGSIPAVTEAVQDMELSNLASYMVRVNATARQSMESWQYFRVELAAMGTNAIGVHVSFILQAPRWVSVPQILDVYVLKVPTTINQFGDEVELVPPPGTYQALISVDVYGMNATRLQPTTNITVDINVQAPPSLSPSLLADPMGAVRGIFTGMILNPLIYLIVPLLFIGLFAWASNLMGISVGSIFNRFPKPNMNRLIRGFTGPFRGVARFLQKRTVRAVQSQSRGRQVSWRQAERERRTEDRE